MGSKSQTESNIGTETQTEIRTESNCISNCAHQLVIPSSSLEAVVLLSS